MKVVKEIISESEYGSVEQMEVGNSITVDGRHFLDLTIEKITDEKLSVAHYYELRGDLMSDPDIVFNVSGDEWIPVRFTNHPHTHHHDEDGLPEVEHFVETWNKNLQNQGFLERFTESDE